MRLNQFIFLALCLTHGLGVLGQSTILTSDIDAFINGLLTDWHSPGGVSVAVVKKNADASWSVETKGYGNAKADGTKVTEQTLMSIGSDSKLFDALATGLLIANETLSPRITWTTKLKSILPQWGLMDPVADAETSIIDVMSHRTGVPRHDFMVSSQVQVPDMINRMRFLRPSTEFRQTFQYNNWMYTLLSYLPTALIPSNPKFSRYVKANIFDPLGMNSTTYSFVVANRTGNLADGFSRQPSTPPTSPIAAGISRAIPFWDHTGEDGDYVSGPGGIISNAVDMATWLQTLLSEGRHPRTNASVIPSDAIDMVSTGVSVMTGSSTSPFVSPLVYGGGQWQGTYRGHVVDEHDGGTPGFLSFVSRLPFDGIGISVLTNDDNIGDSISIAIKYRLMDQALGLEPLDIKSMLAQSITQTFESIPAPPSRPSNATLPAGGVAPLAGVYQNDGYGKVEFCLASPTNASQSVSSSCRALLSNITTVLPGAIDPSVPTLIAKWDRAFGAYARMVHFNGNVFSLSALESYPTGNASEPFWTRGLDTFGPTAEFSQDGGKIGFGFFGGAWGAGDGVPDPSGNTVKERAEVWFTKA